MARTKLYALARSLTLAASVGAPCIAAAADLLPPPPPPPVAPPVEIGGGWYLRGDVGASIYDKVSYRGGYDTHAYGTDQRNFGDRLGGGGFAGVGVGYQFNNWLRGDVTGEYRYSTGLRGNEYYKGPDYDDGLGSYGYNKASGHFDSGVVLANGYFDLGTWYGITPFVGGGVGVAFNHVSGFQKSESFTSPVYGYDYANPVYVCPCGPPTYNWRPVYGPDGNPIYQTNTSPKFYKDKTSASFAWALHAGLAYNVTDALKIELAYRYLNMGTAKTGTSYVLCCTETGSATKVRDLEAHDVKIGLRYMLGAPAVPLPALAPDYPPPGPIVRKY